VLSEHTTFVVFAVLAIFAEAWIVFLAFFDPGLRYGIASKLTEPLGSQGFRTTLEAITDAKLHCGTRFEVLTNGENFYESMLSAIREAERSINMECYIFKKGTIGDLTASRKVRILDCPFEEAVTHDKKKTINVFIRTKSWIHIIVSKTTSSTTTKKRWRGFVGARCCALKLSTSSMFILSERSTSPRHVQSSRV